MQYSGEEPNLQECLVSHGVSLQEYDDLIEALARAAPKDPFGHVRKRYDSAGFLVATTTVRRVFDEVAVVAEDRGAVWAVGGQKRG